MNKDWARKLIAIVAVKKQEKYSKNDFINSLSYKNHLLRPDTVTRFLNECEAEKLLIKNGDYYIPNFSTSGIIVPLDFSIDEERLFSEDVEKPLVDRILDTAAASGLLTKKETVMRARELMETMKFIDFEIALLAILSDNGIDVKSLVQEKSGN
ncbi:DUF2240 family protein [Picrophilus oshimae]|uniref:DUF2240 family protein n=1 Tax=Picrophilus torridus (strain ATCC 700027 / DSM 9790 / JCM 10055 / NBRC 100828 / KAW 2/3) TaxID=1122961 RepID=Q6L2J6_PICTO|nr:DUF2240 family protein [Picrophilus oshimae]AAT42806.1 hypothetical protein PTO0221 [Picrophilus oshimae DSM 9789]SMD31567.1 hypothetical protein SAMN02745355_1518 [Picrophilus oshimae DSM 9789]